MVLFDENSDLIAFYAHLRAVNLESGDRVLLGNVIGEEGKTGSAGHRHLHFSVHRNIWKLTPDLIKEYGIWLPPSIPWRTHILEKGGNPLEVHVNDLPCEDNSDLTRPSFQGA